MRERNKKKKDEKQETNGNQLEYFGIVHFSSKYYRQYSEFCIAAKWNKHIFKEKNLIFLVEYFLDGTLFLASHCDFKREKFILAR